MRLSLSQESKKKLFLLLKEKNECNSIGELSSKLKISKKTLQGWFYLKNKTIPEEIVDKDISNEIEIIERKERNWGQVYGGRIGHSRLLEKYGKEGVKKINSKGGLNAYNTKIAREKPFVVNLSDPIFLEFYGSLMGDGWLSNYVAGGKRVWIIGLCGHLVLDREYLSYCIANFERLFNRKGCIQEKHKTNAIQVCFKHKLLLKYLNEKLNFPIGKKRNLEIHSSIYKQGYDKVKYTIRGIFDTDGSFYLEKSKLNSLPRISIHMEAPVLIKQIGDILLKRGFKLSYSNNGTQLKLSGKIQLDKWMNEIGSSNPKHLNKITKFLQNEKMVYI
jgi:hypothetical protein